MHIYVRDQEPLLSVVRSGVRAHFYFISVFNRYKFNRTSEINLDNLHVKP